MMKLFRLWSLAHQVRDAENNLAGLDLEYRKSCMDMQQRLIEYRVKLSKEAEDLAIAAANDTAAREHVYHSKQEGLGIEIAKLEAKRDFFERETNYVYVLNVKDNEIERLTDLCKALAGAQTEEEEE